MDWQSRFVSRVRKAEGCWEYDGYADSRGYRKASVGGRRKKLAHRIAYEIWVGPIPEGLTIDHLCRNTGCVNPAHLEAVTLAENIRRAHPERSHCPHGHDLTGGDVYLDRGHRKCGVCVRARVRRYGARKRMERRERAADGAAVGEGRLRAS